MNKRALKRVGATPGIYKRDNTYYAGYSLYGKWTITALDAESVTEAKKARESLLAGLREGRIAQRNGARFSECFDEYQGARSLSERTREHERHLCDRHLSALVDRPVQDVTASDIAKLLRGMRDGYSPWTQVAVFRVLVGTFALATRRGIITRNPMDGLARSEKPKQRNARRVAVLDADAIAKLAHAGGSERWTAAIALAGYAGLRLGEIRALRWSDVVLDGETISVRRSLLPDGTVKATKTEAGTRAGAAATGASARARQPGGSARLEPTQSTTFYAPRRARPSQNAISVARSTRRRRAPSSRSPRRSGSPGTRYGIRTRLFSRPTSSYRQRLSLGSPGTRTPGSRSASTRATGETKRQLSRTFSRGLQELASGRKARPRRESTETQQRRMLPERHARLVDKSSSILGNHPNSPAPTERGGAAQ